MCPVVIDSCPVVWQNPRLQTTLKVARAIDNALDNFKQWSDVSEFYVEPERVLEPDPQDLDEDGCVTTVGQVVNLVAFAHVVAAKIYVNCRLFRYNPGSPKNQISPRPTNSPGVRRDIPPHKSLCVRSWKRFG